MPGSSIPTPTSRTVTGDRAHLPRRRTSSTVPAAHQPWPLGVAPGTRPVGASFCAWVWRGSSCLCLPFPALCKRSPCLILSPGPGEIICSVAPITLPTSRKVIQGQGLHVNLPGLFDHLWAQEILGLSWAFWSKSSLCRVGRFCRTAAQD